jgi:hypothetical protein
MQKSYEEAGETQRSRRFLYNLSEQRSDHVIFVISTLQWPPFPKAELCNERYDSELPGDI